MGADMLDATEPTAHIAPDPDVPNHALFLSGIRVSLDAGRELWKNQIVTLIFPRVSARCEFRLLGKPDLPGSGFSRLRSFALGGFQRDGPQALSIFVSGSVCWLCQQTLYRACCYFWQALQNFS